MRLSPLASTVSFALIALAGGLATPSCTGGGDATHKIIAYDTRDSCVVYQDQDSCTAQTGRCQWIPLGVPCTEGQPCQSGVCQEIDPCRSHTDPDACAADSDNRCAWAAVGMCPAGGDCGEDGYCYQTSDDDSCTCACPAYCPPGQDCPPCQCDCDGCDQPPTTCECPTCPAGTDCPPCDCSGGGAPTPAGGNASADVPTYEGDPCSQYGDQQSCTADQGNDCQWLPDPCPLCDCPAGDPSCSCDCTQTYSCHGSTGGCSCVCPTCEPGTECPPCACTCDGGGGCGSAGSGSTGGGTGTVDPAPATTGA